MTDRIAYLKAIIVCGQSDGLMVQQAQKELIELEGIANHAKTAKEPLSASTEAQGVLQ